MPKRKDTPPPVAETFLPVMPRRTLVGAEDALKRASRCSDITRHEARNFNNLEFNKISFTGEDLSSCRANYSKFTDCEFSDCNFEHTEFLYSVFENCRFNNCRLEKSDFSYAILDKVSFTSCNLNSSDFPYARGEVTLKSCLMTRCTAFYSALKLTLSDTAAVAFRANVAEVDLDAVRSSFRNGEFNDSTLRGSIVKTDLTRSEFNRADMSQLKITDCPGTPMGGDEEVWYEDIPDNELIDIFSSKLDSDFDIDSEFDE